MRPSWDLFWNWRLVAYRTQWLRFLQISREMQNVDGPYIHERRSTHRALARRREDTPSHTATSASTSLRRKERDKHTSIVWVLRAARTLHAVNSERALDYPKEHRRRARHYWSKRVWGPHGGGEATITMQFMLRQSMCVLVNTTSGSVTKPPFAKRWRYMPKAFCAPVCVGKWCETTLPRRVSECLCV